jgi:hypothetical protein
MRSFWFICMIAVLTLSLSACGGGEKKATRAFDDAALREMVMITSEGLPWAISIVNDEAMSNEAAAGEYPNSEQWLSNYEEWGRTGGHSADFSSEGSGISGVQTEVESYSSTGGAESAWSAVHDFVVSGEALQRLRAEGFSDAQIAEVDGEKVGEESAAFRIGVTLEDKTAETFIVLSRREGVLAMASVGGDEGSVAVEDAVAVAKQLDARIQDVLKR